MERNETEVVFFAELLRRAGVDALSYVYARRARGRLGRTACSCGRSASVFAFVAQLHAGGRVSVERSAVRNTQTALKTQDTMKYLHPIVVKATGVISATTKLNSHVEAVDNPQI